MGTALAVVGAGVVASLALTMESSQATRTGVASVNDLAASTGTLMLVPAVPTGDGAAELTWSASAPSEVWWFEEVPCTPEPGLCIVGGALAHWSGTPTGEWSWHGSVSNYYGLVVEATSNRSVNFSASFAESYPVLSHLLPTVPFVWTMVGGSVLLGIGGMAVYLGLFLPSGVYSTPETAPFVPDPEAEYSASDPRPPSDR